MIVVLADDLSGAAEMGGMAFRHGQRADVLTASAFGGIPSNLNVADLDADVLVIDTDSRSCSADEAMRRVSLVAEQYSAMPVAWIFKKVDSVLRGHVVAELGSLLDAFGRQRSLLIPANPALGRTIHKGRYFVDGRPLHETDFANDPEYPAFTSDVVDLLARRDSLGIAGRWPISVVSSGDPFPAFGIMVGETTSAADLAAWARAIPSDAVASGAADFFGAMLEATGRTARCHEIVGSDDDERAKRLFVCGSSSAGSHRFCRDAEARGIPVLRLPPGLLEPSAQADELLLAWVAATVDALHTHSTAIIAIDRPLRREPDLPQRLTGYLGAAVEDTLVSIAVNHLLVEGGATAAALIRRFGWDRLHVLQELAPGVVSVQVAGRVNLVLTMKPGSYAWPAEWLG